MSADALCDPINPRMILRRHIEPLTTASFAPFGTIIEVPETGGRSANFGTALRYDDVAPLVLDAAGGRPQLSIFRVVPALLPLRCMRLERHPLSTQLFLPIGDNLFLAVVAQGVDAPDPQAVRAFISNGHQGVNYAPGIWHHPVIAINCEMEFLVLGRAPAVEFDDCDEAPFTGEIIVEVAVLD